MDFDTYVGANEIHANFRTAQGELTAGSARTDGDLLAVTGSATERDIFAAGARTVSADGTPLVSSNTPVDLVLHDAAGVREFHIASTVATKASFHMSRPPSELLLDGKRIVGSYVNQGISLSLTEGEHFVSIRP